MKIAFFKYNLISRGGVERSLIELISYLTKKRHTCTIFTLFYDKDKTFEEFKELDVQPLRQMDMANHKEQRWPFRVAKSALLDALQTKLDVEGYDTLVLMSSGREELMLLRNRKRPMVYYCSSLLQPVYTHREFRASYYKNPILRFAFYFLTTFYKPIHKVLLGNFDMVMCNSENIKNQIIKHGIADPSKLRVVYPGVNTNTFKKSDIFEHFFFFPSRFIRLKQHPLIIDAFKKFYQQNPGLRNFRLIMVGPSLRTDKDYMRELRKNSKGYPVDMRTNIGERELLDLYKRCYSVVFPSRQEAWGLVPLEAMACGKPVISANQGGPMESILHKKTGRLIEPTADEFASAMKYFAENPGVVRKMGKAARARAEEFSCDKMAKVFEESIEEVIGEYHRPT